MVKRSVSLVVIFAACMTGCAGLLGVDDVSYSQAATLGAADGEPVDDHLLPDGSSTTSPDARAASPGADGTDAQASKTDATPFSTDAGPDVDPAVTACMKATCNAQGAQCGPVAAICGGQPVDCGQCQPGYYCGDNKRPNQCGYFCLDTQLVNYCPNSPAHAFNYGCSDPYWAGPDGGAVFRPGGIVNCVYHQASANLFLECCP